MNNLRFRIWNESRMEFGGGDSQIKLCVCRHSSGDVEGALSDSSAQEIMLATGIKDKDLSEVYEGDICQGKISIACTTKEIERGIVEYKPESARFELKCSDSSLPLNMVSGLKVMGHIYNDSTNESKSSTQ